MRAEMWDDHGMSPHIGYDTSNHFYRNPGAPDQQPSPPSLEPGPATTSHPPSPSVSSASNQQHATPAPTAITEVLVPTKKSRNTAGDKGVGKAPVDPVTAGGVEKDSKQMGRPKRSKKH
jgi:hypothetical protein